LVKFVPYDENRHRTQFFDLNVELITWISEQMRVYHNIDSVSIMGQTVREYVEMVFENFTAIKPPKGILYILEIHDDVAGMGALKPLADGVGEIKRMYIRPKYRGQGFGKAMLQRLIQKAKTFGYATLRLETSDYSTTAHHIYRSAGFQEIDEYPDVETPEWYRPYCLFMEKHLYDE
jgi:GNAT superfamily N-acetyltransferase